MSPTELEQGIDETLETFDLTGKRDSECGSLSKGLAMLLSKSFWAQSSLLDLASLATSAWTGAALVYAWLITTVLVRKIEGHEGPRLTLAVPIALIHDLKTNLGSVTRAKPVQRRA